MVHVLGEVAKAMEGRLVVVRSHGDRAALFQLEAWPGGCPLASHFVSERYAAEGFSPSTLRQPTDGPGRQVTTFVARSRGFVVGTVTVAVVDDRGALEASGAYPFETTVLRRQHPLVAEFVQLATERTATGRASLLALLQVGLLHAFASAADAAVAEVHPSHAGFYGRVLGMRKAAADVRTCPRVGAPGVMLLAGLEELAQRVGWFTPQQSSESPRRWFCREDAKRLLCELEIACSQGPQSGLRQRLAQARWDRFAALGPLASAHSEETV